MSVSFAKAQQLFDDGVPLDKIEAELVAQGVAPDEAARARAGFQDWSFRNAMQRANERDAGRAKTANKLKALRLIIVGSVLAAMGLIMLANGLMLGAFAAAIGAISVYSGALAWRGA